MQAAITELQQAVSQMPAFAPQTQVLPSEDGSAIRVQAFFQGTTQSDAAFGAITELRDEVVPQAFEGVPGVEVLVGGNTAFFVDFLELTNTYQWIVLAFVLGLSFLLLMVVFRSIVVPIKAIIMNLLSVAAAYGAITLVFQKGVGIGLVQRRSGSTSSGPKRSRRGSRSSCSRSCSGCRWTTTCSC